MQLSWSSILRLPLALLIAASVLLAGCASRPILPAHMPDLALPRSVHVVLHGSDTPAQDSMLVAQQEAAGIWRWSLFDPLGLPLARQILQDGQWRNDGFLAPNAAARTLFSALIFAWTPDAALTSVYPAGSWSQTVMPDGSRQRQLRHNGKIRWTITWQDAASADIFTIHAADGLLWQISPLKGMP